LLDEATTALKQGRTTISMTHSAEVMKTANRIIVLVEEIIVEESSFEELMGKQGAL
jgi:ABC-type multidrug transport system fused ATPase/permease subunit